MQLMSVIKQWINAISFHMLNFFYWYHAVMVHCWLFTVTSFIVLLYSVFLVDKRPTLSSNKMIKLQ